MSNVSMIDGHIDEPKVTDEQIMNIAEEYARRQCENRCEMKNCDACMVNYVKQTIEIARNQQAEIERLREVIETMTNEEIQFGFEVKSNIERVQKIERAEATKEFAERFEKEIETSPYMSVPLKYTMLRNARQIKDNLVKEMAGDK